MPIVNIRDDDGKIVDVVSINLNGGGGSGGNYAPADAIVDQSLETAWVNCRDDYGDGKIFELWKWEKRIDGTFTILGFNSLGFVELGEPGDIYEGDILYSEEYLPFDIYDIEYTYSCFSADMGAGSLFDYADTILVDFQAFSAHAGEANAAALTLTRTEELIEQMRNAGIDGFGVQMSLQITGRWRKD